MTRVDTNYSIRYLINRDIEQYISWVISLNNDGELDFSGGTI